MAGAESAVIAALAGVALGVPVSVGMPPQLPSGDFAAIAWAGPEIPAVITQETVESFTASHNLQHFEVLCQLTARQGTVDLQSAVARAYAMRDLFVAAVATDKTLGGACMSAVVTGSTLMPNQTDQGAIATVTAVVSVQAFR